MEAITYIDNYGNVVVRNANWDILSINGRPTMFGIISTLTGPRG